MAYNIPDSSKGSFRWGLGRGWSGSLIRTAKEEVRTLIGKAGLP